MAEKSLTTQQFLAELRRRMGNSTIKGFAADHGISRGYLSEVLAGKKAPGDSIARLIGYRRVTTYERVTEEP